MARKQKIKNHRRVSFGSAQWIASALKRKFQAAPDKPAEELSSVTDYLYLRKLQRLISPPKAGRTEFIWVDPPEWNQPTLSPSDPGVAK